MQFPCTDARLVPGRTAVPSKASSVRVAAAAVVAGLAVGAG